MLQTHSFVLNLLLSEGQAGDAWEVSYKAILLRAFDTKVLSLFFTRLQSLKVICKTVKGKVMGLQPFHGKEPHWLLWASLRTARGKITTIPNCLNYYDIFIVYTQFTNVAAQCHRLETYW